MKRWWLIALGLVITFLVLSVWQKCTAWQDRYITEQGRRVVANDEILDHMQLNHRCIVAWDGVLWRNDFVGMPPKRVYFRDWTYLPPYFRWFYGGR